jgi:transcription elongation factor GreA
MNNSIIHSNGATPAGNGASPRRSDRLPVTAATHQALQSELQSLLHQKQHDMPERLRTARQFGDGSNNDEHLAILEEEAVIDARIARLEDILSRADVVDPAESGDTVAIGSTVTVRDTTSAKGVDYVIASAHADTAPGHVSAVSPVGEALLGRRRGETVSVTLPRGRTRQLEVMAISHPDP